MTGLPPLPEFLLEPIVRAALMEDLGGQGDITTRTVIPRGTCCRVALRARLGGVVSGGQVARTAFRLFNPNLRIETIRADGDTCAPDDIILEIEGPAEAILSAERVALNFMGRMCGIASLTAAFVDEARGTDTRITCTRKTTPGLRLLEKQAVCHGGGYNHRYSLSDAILIKDNHIAIGGGIAPVLGAVKAGASHMTRVEIEVDRLDQLREVLKEGGADVVLLDNMDTETLREAVAIAAGQVILEASGNMSLARIAEVAATGVDYISSGALTHSAISLDLGLDFIA